MPHATPLLARKQPFHSALRELQAVLRERHLADPSSHNQIALFHLYAPFFAFLSIFVLGVLIPRYGNLDSKNGASTFATVLKVCCLVVLGVFSGLLVLRALIWVGVRLVTSFCEMDLSEREAGTIGEDDDKLELTQANLIVGGLFG